MFDRILVPLDGSQAAEVALEVAAQIPDRRLQLFSVEPDCTDLSELCPGARERETSVETVAPALREQSRTVTTIVAFGNPAAQINAVASGADLIVMSSHGHGAMGRALFRSAAGRLS